MFNNFSIQLVAVECCNCHTIFGMTKETNDQKRKDHTSFYCPAGHGQTYTGQSEEEKLRLERDRLLQRQAYKDDEIKRLEGLTKEKDHRIAGLKGSVTKIKKRTANGVCPCCNRTFQDLARHMQGQHPEFEKEAV